MCPTCHRRKGDGPIRSTARRCASTRRTSLPSIAATAVSSGARSSSTQTLSALGRPPRPTLPSSRSAPTRGCT
uniref:hypothetical protein n=1 Tax=Streptomyces xylophagus TaxID=285514 RepID=UPI003899F6C5